MCYTSANNWSVWLFFFVFLFYLFTPEHPDTSSSPQKMGTLNWYHSQKLQQYLSAEHRENTHKVQICLGPSAHCHLLGDFRYWSPHAQTPQHSKSSSVLLCIGSLKAQKTQSLWVNSAKICSQNRQHKNHGVDRLETRVCYHTTSVSRHHTTSAEACQGAFMPTVKQVVLAYAIGYSGLKKHWTLWLKNTVGHQ